MCDGDGGLSHILLFAWSGNDLKFDRLAEFIAEAALKESGEAISHPLLDELSRSGEADDVAFDGYGLEGTNEANHDRFSHFR